MDTGKWRGDREEKGEKGKWVRGGEWGGEGKWRGDREEK